MRKNAVIIGNSDGIGLAITKALLDQDWYVFGISKSQANISNKNYETYIAHVQNDDFTNAFDSILNEVDTVDLCIYCAGIGELLDLNTFNNEELVFQVNLLGLVKTTKKVIPKMIQTGQGHFIGLSSVADDMLSSEAPSYHASKAAFSKYLEGLALALKSKGIYVTNIRFGFVDTKMAKGDVKPFMMSVDRAKDHLLKCISQKPIRYTAPKIVIPLVKFRSLMLRLKTLI